MDRTTLNGTWLELRSFHVIFIPFSTILYIYMYLTKRSFSNKVWKRKVFDKLFSSFFCASPPSLLLFYINITFFKRIWNVLSSHHYYVCVCVLVIHIAQSRSERTLLFYIHKYFIVISTVSIFFSIYIIFTSEKKIFLVGYFSMWKVQFFWKMLHNDIIITTSINVCSLLDEYFSNYYYYAEGK